MALIILKRCYKCDTWKTPHEFGVDNSRGDGLKAKCITCCRVKVKVCTKGRPSVFKGRKHTPETIAHFKAINSGWNNPNWKGGITTLLTNIRNTAEYKAWRISVYRNGNYTCVDCGVKKHGRNIILDADHINPLAKIIFDNNIKTVADALLCHEIFDLKNGRCLCRECHKKTETWGVNINQKSNGIKIKNCVV